MGDLYPWIYSREKGLYLGGGTYNGGRGYIRIGRDLYPGAYNRVLEPVSKRRRQVYGLWSKHVL